jgi:hypothetical protein
MNDNQIPDLHIKEKFNAKSSLTLEERVKILRESLPPEKQSELKEIKDRLNKEAAQLNEKQERERPLKLQNAYHAAYTHLLQSAQNSKMPPPSAKTIEHNASLAAQHNVAKQENINKEHLKKRGLEFEYDFLKKQQPDHPLVKAARTREAPQPSQQITKDFNTAAAKTAPER